MNKCEREIDTIRLKLYEETKDLTREADNKRLYELGQKLSLEFGFRIIPASNESRKKPDVI